MTVKEVFELWKKETFNGNLCKHGQVAGYICGYYGFESCKVHSDVRYGGVTCPKDCNSFTLADDEELFKRFMIYYSNSPSYYNDKYNINKSDPNYVKTAKELIKEAQDREANAITQEMLDNIENLMTIAPETEGDFLDNESQ